MLVLFFMEIFLEMLIYIHHSHVCVARMYCICVLMSGNVQILINYVLKMGHGVFHSGFKSKFHAVHMMVVSCGIGVMLNC